MAKRRRRRSAADKRIREQELRKEQNMETMRKLMILVVIVAIVGVAWWAFGGGGNDGPEPTSGLQINSQGEVEIATSEVTNSANYYSIEANGVDVRFFAVRADDGKVRVAMDACDVCYDAKKGYRQDGDNMVCNNCGNRYPTEGIGTENIKGGCWPSYVPMKIEDGKVIIKASDLKAKRYMFD
ncbi:MAG: DUF2318 domain-containing protein [Thermoplasmata archaeon]|nr:DUF2318 domain-containing protein [Thermoplasmata archaeon]NIS12304.1 DUF2318 domain-containing protein [Thermoplasmata archaeon]NIS20217.1 DUF2318 domain-containing protein [Thermoplasmata archaeon]NIT77558.1 DUF2318 domain-containing protein [Thermoplasmata archaeon]NIU49316.1 DUF2318 domain-containing protein [Thermoplasmata archaeon]